MTKGEWLSCTEPQKMLEFLRGKVSERKLRLFALACCRRIEHLFQEKCCRDGLQKAEEYLEEAIGKSDLQSACIMVRDAYRRAAATAIQVVARDDKARLPIGAVFCLLMDDAYCSASDASRNAAHAIAEITRTSREKEIKCQDGFLRDIFSNPFRPVKLDSAWQTANVVALARGIYEECAFDRMPILADALEDAGCTNPEILNHCREPGVHVRGCWVVDLVLGRSYRQRGQAGKWGR
jgi:hypothetical protein